MPKCRLCIQASTYGTRIEELHEEDNKKIGNIGVDGNIRSKNLSHFVKGKIFLTPMETILIIPRELKYLEGLMKLARKRKYVEVAHSERVKAH